MGQMGFFDIANRYAGLDAKNDPLVKIDEVVPWEDFRPRHDAWAFGGPRREHGEQFHAVHVGDHGDIGEGKNGPS